MAPDKLVYMANQLGKFFITQPRAAAAEQIASHLKMFWDPSLRRAILTHLDWGGPDLDEAVRMAVERLRPSDRPH